MKSDISLSLDLINVKDSQNHFVGVSKPRLSVLGCLEQYNLNETSNCFYFFQILRFKIGGAAYTRTFTVFWSCRIGELFVYFSKPRGGAIVHIGRPHMGCISRFPNIK